MSITIVHKSDSTHIRPNATKALLLAGGAITGGSFKAGGLKALDDYLGNFRVTDFDIFVGISSGSFIAAALSGGIPPEVILRSLDGTSKHFSALRPWHYYYPNFAELVHRPLDFTLRAVSWLPGQLWKALKHAQSWSGGFSSGLLDFLQRPNTTTYDEMVEQVAEAGKRGFPSLVDLLPSGIFDNAPIERYFRENIRRNHLTNDFVQAEKLSGKRLYISAMALDGAGRVVFGPDEKNDVSISEAVMASTAVPGFYKPARIQGVDYVDGGVQETADIDLAVRKGAQLIVCYNPFRPYQRDEFVERMQRSHRKEASQPLAEGGIMAVLNQIFRAAFHARLQVALRHYEDDPNFHGDIILIEPRADDIDFFLLNPLSLANRMRAARMGFATVRNAIEEQYDQMSAIFALYGVKMHREQVEREYRQIEAAGDDQARLRSVLESKRSGTRRKSASAGRRKKKSS